MINRKYGAVNGPLIGHACKEMVGRAIHIIQKHRFHHEVTAKKSYLGDKPDVFTNADKEAQEMYVKLLTEAFPGYGVIAEEKELTIPVTCGTHHLFFTVDPLDGTKAFTRRQSHGIGTMLALACDGEIIAAFVGDALTGEIYYYRPDSEKVHRLSGDDLKERLEIDPSRTLATQKILLRDEHYKHSALVEMIIAPRKDETPRVSDGLVNGYEVGGGSIGIHMARLWKGEVGATILLPGAQTPWDTMPVNGISKRLGFVHVELDIVGEEMRVVEPKVLTTIEESHNEILVIHKSRLDELEEWHGAPLIR